MGGQNLIEAAACACPLVMGPHTFNFLQAAEQSLAAGAALRVPDVSAGVERALAICNDPAQRQQMSERARRFAALHRGAAAAMASAVLALWP
jgi:3-deoxy-D-manno-octulosonic-acid transferase